MTAAVTNLVGICEKTGAGTLVLDSGNNATNRFSTFRVTQGIVQITGGSGTGATAIAIVDLATNSLTCGQVTAIRVTSPGRAGSSPNGGRIRAAPPPSLRGSSRRVNQPKAV